MRGPLSPLKSQGTEFAQPGGDAGLQVAGRPVPPAPPPTWTSSGVAVRDSCVTFLLSRQKACLG